MTKGPIVECPKCGKSVGGVAVVVGVVKITTFKCQCGRVWRTKGILTAFSVSVFTGEIERLHTKYPGVKPPHVKIAVGYLEAKISDHSCSALEEEEAKRKRRNDHWERQFLKDALGEDY